MTTKRFSLLHTWEIAFIFIIWSDMLLCAADNDNYTLPIFFYTFANSLVLLGYFSHTKTSQANTKYPNTFTEQKWELLFVIIFCILLYLYYNYERVLETLSFGRVLTQTLGSGNLKSTIIPALGMLLPGLIAYYFRYIVRGGTLYALLLVLPIFIYQFIIATRFQLLFQIFPFAIILGFIKIEKINLKSIAFMLLFGIMLGWGSSYIKKNRNFAENETIYEETSYVSENSNDLFYNIAKDLSPEGIIEMMWLADNYYSTHNLEYGKESAYMLYFWVPRSIWKNKPTPIDHWLIRKYENVVEEHSTSTGFIGFLRADFGWFALLFAIIWGIIIKKCDNFIRRILKNKTPGFNYVFAASLYPYIFFAVRSPQTATQQLIFIYIIYICFKHIFFKQGKSNNVKIVSNKLYR
jgi:oligosaccharide repeat unit polymerase